MDSKNEWLLLSVTFTAKLELVFFLNIRKHFFLRVLILKPAERTQVLLKNGTRDFRNSPPFQRSACFPVTTSESFKRFQYFKFEIDFLEKSFSRNWSNVCQLKPLRLKTHHFHSKLLCLKPMLRQIEWRLQNGPIPKSGVLPVTTLFFWKICSTFRTS